jgi:enoyl-CoA hydratase/carnithine racemase
MSQPAAPEDAPVQLQRTGPRAAQLLLNRPAQRNPLDWDTVRALRRMIAEVETDPDVSVVSIRGAGGNFSAGGDLKAYVGLYQRPDDFREFLNDFYHMLDAIERSSKLYIALVEGYCVAGGLELLLACDLVVAPRSARIGDGHLNFGQLPGAGGSQRLPRTIGPARARWLIASGEFIDATEAERFGLVSKVFDDALFDQEVIRLNERLARHSPLGLSGLKHLVNEGLRGHLEAGLKLEMDFVHRYATLSHDATEGLLAFAEKRPPQFRGS